MGRTLPKFLKASRSGARSLRRDESGFTAVEFAMVATPFLMFLFGIINIGLLYFTTFTIENATESAARSIRTGQAKTAGWNQATFKTQVCNRVPSFVDCPNKVRVNVAVIPDGTDPTPAIGTTTGGVLKADTDMVYPASFAGSQIIMVTTFYQWDLAKVLPFLSVGNLTDGSRLVRATVAFKNEPF